MANALLGGGQYRLEEVRKKKSSNSNAEYTLEATVFLKGTKKE